MEAFGAPDRSRALRLSGSFTRVSLVLLLLLIGGVLATAAAGLTVRLLLLLLERVKVFLLGGSEHLREHHVVVRPVKTCKRTS